MSVQRCVARGRRIVKDRALLLLQCGDGGHDRFDNPRAFCTLCVPKRPLRQRTPGRIARSAALFVGGTSAWRTNVHNACRRSRISRHTPSVFSPPSSPAVRWAGSILEMAFDRCWPVERRCGP
jgi:hypothetical protein